MRLDKLVAQSLKLSRKEAKVRIKKARISVNGQISRNPGQIILETDSVTTGGILLEAKKTRYIMLNKPLGFVCSAISDNHSSALDLLGSDNTDKLHFAGRLDVDTTGLVLISDDGQWTHQITAPSHKKSKTYRVTLNENCSHTMMNKLSQGVLLKDSSKPTAPAEVEQIEDKIIRLVLTEGRYHQVKRMLAAVGNHVEALHRESIGTLHLDKSLAGGQWRDLEQWEVALF